MQKTLIYNIIPLIGLAIGLAMATFSHWTISEEFSVFLAMGFIITLNIFFEGVVQYWNGTFRLKATLFGYMMNVFFTFFLLYIGYLLRVDLYIALFIVFGIKLFSNLSYISQRIFSKLPF
jgi:small basic protein